MNKYPFKRYKDSPIIDWEATYTEMPPKVKEYLIATIGEKETKRLMYFMKMVIILFSLVQVVLLRQLSEKFYGLLAIRMS